MKNLADSIVLFIIMSLICTIIYVTIGGKKNAVVTQEVALYDCKFCGRENMQMNHNCVYCGIPNESKCEVYK